MAALQGIESVQWLLHCVEFQSYTEGIMSTQLFLDTNYWGGTSTRKAAKK